MTSLSIVSVDQGKRHDYKVEKWFKASDSPIYIAIITKPSPGLWELLSRSKEIVMEMDGESQGYRIPYRIEVGESTIFFVTPTDESA